VACDAKQLQHHHAIASIQQIIHSHFHWYKKHKNHSRNGRVIVKNKVAHFMAHSVVIDMQQLCVVQKINSTVAQKLCIILEMLPTTTL